MADNPLHRRVGSRLDGKLKEKKTATNEKLQKHSKIQLQSDSKINYNRTEKQQEILMIAKNVCICVLVMSKKMNKKTEKGDVDTMTSSVLK